LHGCLVSLDLDRLLGELRAWVDDAAWPMETIRYGEDEEHAYDLRLPPKGAQGRLAAIVHGGFWRAAFTRANTAAIAVDLARRGWVTCNLEYRRVGSGGGIPETLDDVAAALDHVRTTLAPDRLVVLGHSAGGHLALWAAGTVDAAVSLAGVADLADAARTGIGAGAAVELAGGLPEERPEAYELADPIGRLPARVPTLLVHGGADDRVPVEQSRRYAAAAGATCELLELPGTGHFELIDPRSTAWTSIAERLDDWASRSRSTTLAANQRRRRGIV
jgi:acetyl esterase/lipase